MAIRVLCQVCHRDAHFLAVDLIAYGTAADAHIDNVRFRCSTCRSRKTRAHAVDLDAAPAGYVIVQRLPARR
jgi:hypothetical protein